MPHPNPYHRPRFLRVLLAGLLAGLVFAGLYPFNFFARNQVTWLESGNGVQFRGYGQVYGPWPIKHYAEANAPEEVTIEFLVSSYEGPRPSVESLLTIASSGSEERFAIERWTLDVVVAGLFHDSQGKTVFERLFCDRTFESHDPRLVTVTSGTGGTTVYIDGIRRRNYPGLTLVGKNFDGELLLGQSASAHQEWRGAIAGLAIYPRALSANEVEEDHTLWIKRDIDGLKARSDQLAIYSFDEGQGTVVHDRGSRGAHLVIPAALRALRPAVLKWPTRRDLQDVADIVVNVLGFIPFGALLTLFLTAERKRSPKTAATIAVLACLAISAGIETVQVWLPSRDSSLLDVMMNTVGAAIGAGLALKISRATSGPCTSDRNS